MPDHRDDLARRRRDSAAQLEATDPGVVLRIALSGTDQEAMEATDCSRPRVIQRALRLVDDPAIALAHPLEVQAIRAKVLADRVKRSAKSLRNVDRG